MPTIKADGAKLVVTAGAIELELYFKKAAGGVPLLQAVAQALYDRGFNIPQIDDPDSDDPADLIDKAFADLTNSEKLQMIRDYVQLVLIGLAKEGDLQPRQRQAREDHQAFDSNIEFKPEVDIAVK